MSHSIGKTIKELRKTRGLTQEELAEKIGVTAQAISKWENESGMPDLSQIVPLAHVFGVSTDTLLGTGDIQKSEDVTEILQRAQKKLTFPLTIECLTDKYNVLLDGLKIYPNNFTLILQCMELEISLAYPTNPTYDEKNAKDLYEACEKHANIIFSYDDNVNRILRARMIMAMLHSANGNYEQARKQAEKFPARADFNIHKMHAMLAHWQGDYKTEIISWQLFIMHLLHALMYATVSLGKTYDLVGEPQNAAGAYERAIGILDAVFKEEIKLPLHHVEGGDLYVLLAEKAMEVKNEELALNCLEKAIHYDLYEKQVLIENKFKIKTPLLSSVGGRVGDRYQNLDEIISKECFAPLKEHERYKKLISDIEAYKSSHE